MEINLDIPPMPINQAWAGRRFMTKKYKEWTEECLWRLKQSKIAHYQILPPYKIEIDFYQSKLQDIDSGIKPILDVLVKGELITDDRYIHELLVKKIISKDKKQVIRISKL